MKNPTGKMLVRNVKAIIGRSEDKEIEEEIEETNLTILLCILFLFPLTQCSCRVAQQYSLSETYVPNRLIYTTTLRTGNQ